MATKSTRQQKKHLGNAKASSGRRLRSRRIIFLTVFVEAPAKLKSMSTGRSSMSSASETASGKIKSSLTSRGRTIARSSRVHPFRNAYKGGETHDWKPHMRENRRRERREGTGVVALRPDPSIFRARIIAWSSRVSSSKNAYRQHTRSIYGHWNPREREDRRGG